MSKQERILRPYPLFSIIICLCIVLLEESISRKTDLSLSFKINDAKAILNL